MDEKETAWVLWHMYSDGSSASVHRVYLDEIRARDDYALMSIRDHTTEWRLTETPIYGSRA